MVGSRDEICPRIKVKIEELKKWSLGFASTFEAEVNDDIFVADMSEITCTCKQWDILGITSSHAISCINYMKCNINNYVADCFKKETHKRCYQFALRALNGKKMWPVINEALIATTI